MRSQLGRLPGRGGEVRGGPGEESSSAWRLGISQASVLSQ